LSVTTENISEDAMIVAADNLLSCDLPGEVILDHLESKKHFKLESTGAAIWQLIQEPRSLRELRVLLMDRYDIDEKTCENDLRESLRFAL
jgi:hypothetical protein